MKISRKHTFFVLKFTELKQLSILNANFVCKHYIDRRNMQQNSIWCWACLSWNFIRKPFWYCKFNEFDMCFRLTFYWNYWTNDRHTEYVHFCEFCVTLLCYNVEWKLYYWTFNTIQINTLDYFYIKWNTFLNFNIQFNLKYWI